MPTKSILLLFSLFIAAFSCTNKQDIPPAQAYAPLVSYVNPFIGTGGHGHTYPGASMPFGMVQLSPDTRLDGWDGCSGYHYSDSYIYGFSHTHLSGTGVSDYGDVLLMPMTTMNFHNGADGQPGYRAHFSHENEEAAPGYYKVLLDSANIEVELTVTPRAGMHKYQYPAANDQKLIIDLEHRDMLLDADIQQIDAYTFAGFRRSKAWAEDQHVYYYIRFSHATGQPLFHHATSQSKRTKAGFVFDNPDNEPVYVRVGISAVDIEGARKNLEAEIGGKSFEEIKEEASTAWESQLKKIVVESDNPEYKTNFYTALYHTMLAPNLYQDVDGRYRGMDLQVHQTQEFDYYTVFSLWDTYRAAHPLYTLIEQDRTNDFINTFLAKYQEGGIMPIWDLSANYTGCMIGYHAVPVIADAYLKGIDGYDAELAFAAMKHSAQQDKLGLAAYKEFGFIPVEEESESVSKTLEYAYDDWTIAQMAKALNKTDDYHRYLQRAQNYKNLFDPETGFMRGRFRNTWFAPFDAYEVNFNYTEANAWQYSLYVPQDVSGLMNLMGGKTALESHLDALFSAETETSGRDQADITGLIGQYAHGNEPSHHMAYLYNFVNRPDKTQEKVRQILTELYTNEPDGISGNEDCGQMSAWYVFSSLGFYPVTPGDNTYVIGTPLVSKATLNFENGQQFTLVANNLSEENIYIESVRLNGEALQRSFLTHGEIIAGGNLEFDMVSAPTKWETAEGQQPITEITEQAIVTPPFIAEGDIAFKENTTVRLAATKGLNIFYKLGNEEFQPYNNPITINEPSRLFAYSEKDGAQSKILETDFYEIDPNLSIRLETTYANQYNAGRDDALIDGIRGARDFRTGAWQGYQDTDVIAIVDLGKVKPIDNIEVNFLQDQRSWIFYPTQVEYYVSDSPRFYKNLPVQTIDSETPAEETEIKTLTFDMNGYSARYVKIVAKNLGDLPEWHLGAPYNGKAWIFIDEIGINQTNQP